LPRSTDRIEHRLKTIEVNRKAVQAGMRYVRKKGVKMWPGAMIKWFKSNIGQENNREAHTGE
jgi:hypothetical protein